MTAVGYMRITATKDLNCTRAKGELAEARELADSFTRRVAEWEAKPKRVCNGLLTLLLLTDNTTTATTLILEVQ